MQPTLERARCCNGEHPRRFTLVKTDIQAPELIDIIAGASRYGTHARLPVDETKEVDPLSPHAVGKLAREMYLRAYAEMYCLEPISLAMANVYGPRQSPHGAAGRESAVTVYSTVTDLARLRGLSTS